MLIDPKALGKVLKSDDILKHIETDFPAAYKRMDNGLPLAEDQAQKSITLSLRTLAMRLQNL